MAFIYDANGFRLFPLRSGSKAMFVSSTLGSDSNDGTQLHPFQTIRKAFSLLKPSDQIFLKTGDVYPEWGNLPAVDGVDVDYPVLISSYGTCRRPLTRLVNGGQAWGVDGRTKRSNLAIVRQEFYCAGRNSRDAAYNQNAVGTDSYSARFLSNGGSSGFYYEDNKISFFTEGLQVMGDSTGRNTGTVFRRNIVVDNYAIKCQGIYLDYADGYIVEDNFFDHNGWTDDGKFKKVILNHSLYAQTTCGPGTVQRNTFANSDGAQVRSGGVLSDNLFYRTIIAGFVAQNPSEMKRNVVVGGNDFDPYTGNDGKRANGIGTVDCDCVIDQNIVANLLPLTGDDNSWGYEVSSSRPGYNITWGTNYICNWRLNRVSTPTPANSPGPFPVLSPSMPVSANLDSQYIFNNRNRRAGVWNTGAAYTPVDVYNYFHSLLGT